MFTIFLAWINAKYSYDYDGLFVITTLLDVLLIGTIYDIFVAT